MSEDVLGTTRTRMRTLIAVAIAIVVLGVAVVIYALNTGSAARDEPGSATAAPSSQPKPSATPAPAAPSTEPGAIDDDAATSVVTDALALPLDTAGSPEDLDTLVKNLATDSYAKELESEWLELSSQGWTRSGSPTVISTEVTKLDAQASPPTAELTACIDTSDVVVSDADGTALPSTSTPRALHLFSLVQTDEGTWRIARHSYPDNPNC